MPKIVIDPGHGGTDPGAVGNGPREKDLTLQTGLYLRDILAADNRYQWKMTRETDQGCQGLQASTAAELTARANVAHDFGADLFVSIHFNSFNKQAFGTEALDYDGAGLGRKFAQAFVDTLEAKEELTDRGVKATHSAFAVIRQTPCAAVITEAAFIDNAADIQHFDTPQELKRLAWYHYLALCIAFDLTPKEELNPDKVQAADPLVESIKKLQAAGVINSPDYWLENARPGKQANGEYVGLLMQKMAAKL